MKIRFLSILMLVLAVAVFFAGCASPENQALNLQSAKQVVGATEESIRPYSLNGQKIDSVEEVLKSGKLYEITFQEVEYFENNDKVEGFLAQPDVIANSPALVLIHEWWGLNDDIKEKAKEFARQGYTVLAVDLYEGRSADTAENARELAAGVQADMGKAFENLNSAVRYLRQMQRVKGEKIATVGWCFGGRWAYQMAKNDLGIAASVMYYGRFNTDDDLSRMKASILGHFGEKDASIKVDDVEQFQATLKTLSGDHEIYIYPNAGHGFANPDNPAYDKEAADLAFKRTLDFLQKNL